MTKVKPFRMIGNVYFVGTVEASSHLIDTGDGLILIDTGYPETADAVVESVNTLGFDIKNVKIILHSHGHYDHTGGTEKLLHLVPTAKTYLSFCDIRYINGFYPDFDIKDGDVIALGNTEIECWFTPGHTEGSVSFFLNVKEGGKVYRAAMFGGSGVRQLKKEFMDEWKVPYLCRGLFFDSVERLLKRKVDVMLGNHTWQNRTLEKYEMMKESENNPFIDPTEWERYLMRSYSSLEKVIAEDSRTKFVNYAVCPENDTAAFNDAIANGANGIRTGVRVTKDGVLVLSSGDAPECVNGEILSFERFLAEFSDKALTFAVELCVDGIEKAVVDLIYEYGADKKTFVISSELVRLQRVKEYAPYVRIGYITKNVDENAIKQLIELGADEIRPDASVVTAENVAKWHRIGFNVCARSTSDADTKRIYDTGADGIDGRKKI